jgi:hypothetical protein
MTIDTKKLAELEGVDPEGLDAPAENITTVAEPVPVPVLQAATQSTPERTQHMRVGTGYARAYGQQCATLHAAPRSVNHRDERKL